MKRNISHLRSALTAEERHSPDPEEIKAALQLTTGAARDHKTRRQLLPTKPLLAAAAVIIIAAGATAAIVSNRANFNDSAGLQVAATKVAPLTSGEPTGLTATHSSAPTTVGAATPTSGIPPVPSAGPLAMVPGTPGVNRDNQSLQPKPAAGGPLSIVLRNGCAYLDLPSVSDNKDPVAVFDSGSTVLNGSTISYWGLAFNFDETVSIGYGELTLSQIQSEYDTLYLPEACSRTGAFAVLNTINAE